MRAAIYEGPGRPLRIGEIDDPSPGAGEAVIKVRSCGICGTDLAMTSGEGRGFSAPCIMGHEIAGEIAAVGAGVDLRTDDRVVAMPFLGCGACAACDKGLPNLCAGVKVVGIGGAPGAYAEFVKVSATSCLPLDPALTFDDGALVEPFAVSLHGLRTLGDRLRGARVMVLGAGMIGLAAVAWAERLGAVRVGVAARSARAQPLAQRLGADAFVAGEAMHDPSAIADALGGAPDVVVECVGKPGMLPLSVDMVGQRGSILVLGFCTSEERLSPARAVSKELSIHFSKLYEREDFARVMEDFSTRGSPAEFLVGARTDLDGLPVAFEAARVPSASAKVILQPSATA